MADLDDVVSSLSEVENAITASHHEIVSAIKSIKPEAPASGWSVIIGGICVFLIISWMGDLWHAKWRYALAYGVDSAKVEIAKEPHDCNFLAAPLGAKYCDYNRVVSTMRWGTSKSSGNAVVSYDEGKTWSPFTPEPGAVVPQYSTVEAVYITWEKTGEGAQ
jgi:hypothetical protein